MSLPDNGWASEMVKVISEGTSTSSIAQSGETRLWLDWAGVRRVSAPVPVLSDDRL